MSWMAFERRWRDALLAALVPPAAGVPGIASLDLAPFWDELGQVAPPLLRVGFRFAIWFLTLAPLLTRLRLFPALSPAEQERFLTAANVSRIYLVRQLVLTVKTIACFAYFRDPLARKAIEEHGPT